MRCRWAAGLPPVGAEDGELPWPIAHGIASEPRLPTRGGRNLRPMFAVKQCRNPIITVVVMV